MRDLKPGQKALEFTFQGKKVLVTGGGRGIGRGLVKRLYDDGAVVFTIEREPELVAQLKKDFPKARCELGDVSDWEETQKTIEEFGPLDYLINNAGATNLSSFLDTTEKTFNANVNVNMKGTFCVSQAVAKGMINGGRAGSIVNIGTISTSVAHQYGAAYAASKGGMDTLTKNLAFELGKHNIRVNSLAITATATEMYQEKGVPIVQNDNNLFLHRKPLAGANLLEVDEVVDSCLFLLSPLSSMTNGHHLVVDGGISVC